MAGLLLCLGSIGAAAAAAKYRSAQDALDQGIGAFNGGYYEIAIPALEYAADAHLFFAPYYLARIYSDNNGSRTDHGNTSFKLASALATSVPKPRSVVPSDCCRTATSFQSMR